MSKAMSSALWTPKEIKGHKLEQLRRYINTHEFVTSEEESPLANYDELHKWSLNNWARFWALLFDFVGIRCKGQVPKLALTPTLKVSDVPLKWFEDIHLNYTENLLEGLENNVDNHDDKIALIIVSEHQVTLGKEAKRVSWGELRASVVSVYRSLSSLGVKRGDVVAAYLPNSELCIYTMLATAAMGGVFTAASADLGVDAVVRRLNQVQPKVLVSVDNVFYNGKTHSHMNKAIDVAKFVGIQHLVVASNNDHSDDIDIFRAKENLQGFLTWKQFLDKGSTERGQEPLVYEQVPFNHPLFIMYSSGTTGSPKCIVHGTGGTLLKHVCEHLIQGNRSADDVIFYYTTIGWMMWNWLVSALALRAKIVLYDGSPMKPKPDSMWDLVDELGITVFGTSAKWLAVQESNGVRPRVSHKLGSLKVICSTGSPLSPESFDYVYRDIKSDLRLSSIIGGTDIIACFMGEISVKPVHRGEVQGALLGCSIEAYDENGSPITDGSRPGELVCTKPFVSQPVAFWNDTEDFRLYKSAYFSKFEGVWAHGDLIHVNPLSEGMVMLGRSDAVLNPNGVRFGSVEIYNVVEKLDEIDDALCVAHVPKGGVDERACLFVKLNQDHKLDEGLVKRIKEAIRKELSAKHVPAVIMEVDDVPYTITGKKVELAIKRILAGNNADNANALRNPEALDIYKRIAKDFN